MPSGVKRMVYRRGERSAGGREATAGTATSGELPPPFAWERFDGFIFDLDGTVYLGETLVPGADRVVAELRRRGRRLVFLSNKPLEPGAAYAAKLTRLGIPTRPEDVITSSQVLIRELTARYPAATVYAIGEAPFLAELREAGVRLVDDPASLGWRVDVVVVAFDRTCTWTKLNHAHQALRRGARLVATNPDPTCPVDGGDVPDAGAILAALQACSGRVPEWVAGKPSTLMVQAALSRLGTTADQTALVGDRLETDIAMARRAGLASVLVLSGVTDRLTAAQAPAELRPDAVLQSVAELLPEER